MKYKALTKIEILNDDPIIIDENEIITIDAVTARSVGQTMFTDSNWKSTITFKRDLEIKISKYPQIFDMQKKYKMPVDLIHFFEKI